VKLPLWGETSFRLEPLRRDAWQCFEYQLSTWAPGSYQIWLDREPSHHHLSTTRNGANSCCSSYLLVTNTDKPLRRGRGAGACFFPGEGRTSTLIQVTYVTTGKYFPHPQLGAFVYFPEPLGRTDFFWGGCLLVKRFFLIPRDVWLILTPDHI
jgi:hypothetical protein